MLPTVVRKFLGRAESRGCGNALPRSGTATNERWGDLMDETAKPEESGILFGTWTGEYGGLPPAAVVISSRQGSRSTGPRWLRLSAS